MSDASASHASDIDGESGDHQPLSSPVNDSCERDTAGDDGLQSPVPAYFSLSQVVEVANALFAFLRACADRHVSNGSDLNSGTVITIDFFLEVCGILTYGDFMELQQPLYGITENFFATHVVSTRERATACAREINVDKKATAIEPSAAVCVDVPSAASTGMKTGDIPRGTTGRRNPVTAAAVAAAKTTSLYRPQSAGQLPLAAPVISKASETASPLSLSTHDRQQSTIAAQGVSVQSTSSPTNHSLPTPAQLVAHTFQEVERVLKDERGQNRFGSAEYLVESRVEDHSIVDRRAKHFAPRAKDESLLHNLEPHRREYMLSYFSNQDLIERRKKELLAEELLRTARQARALAQMSRAPSASLIRCNSPSRSMVDEDHHQLTPHASSSTETKKLWNGASNASEAWNAVRSRPASAAAHLPIQPHEEVKSVVAAKYLPPASQPPRAMSAQNLQQRHTMSFAEMVAQRREVLAHGGAIQNPVASDAVVVINPSTPGGLYKKQSELVQTVLTHRTISEDPNTGHWSESPQRAVTPVYPLATTTITTAAYLPMTESRAPSSLILTSPLRSSSGGKRGVSSAARRKIDRVRAAAPNADSTDRSETSKMSSPIDTSTMRWIKSLDAAQK